MNIESDVCIENKLIVQRGNCEQIAPHNCLHCVCYSFLYSVKILLVPAMKATFSLQI